MGDSAVACGSLYCLVQSSQLLRRVVMFADSFTWPYASRLLKMGPCPWPSSKLMSANCPATQPALALKWHRGCQNRAPHYAEAEPPGDPCRGPAAALQDLRHRCTRTEKPSMIIRYAALQCAEAKTVIIATRSLDCKQTLQNASLHILSQY